MIASAPEARALRQICAAIAALICMLFSHVQAQNVSYHGGPVVHFQPRVYLIYWLPPNPGGAPFVFDPSVADGVGNYRTVTTSFFNVLGLTSYFNILTQYPDKCGAPICTIDNSNFGSVEVDGISNDTTPYPRAPLQDSDIQNEIRSVMTANHWKIPPNGEVFVYTAYNVQECMGGICTNSGGGGFCAYHSSFTGSDNTTILYAYIGDLPTGCAVGISSGVNGQLRSDSQVVVQSHEFFETISDPINGNNAWYNDSTGNEIGDNCNRQGVSTFLRGAPFDVQLQWSNATSSCVFSYLIPEITGLSVPRPPLGFPPLSGPASGNFPVTISGGGFLGTTSVTFGFPPVPAVFFAANSDTTITAFAPPCPVSGCVGGGVTVTNAAGSVSAPNALNILFDPIVTGVSPNGGPTSGGTSVTVTGNGFPFNLLGSGPNFTFGDVPAQNVHCVSSNQCTMIAPAAGPGLAHITAPGFFPSTQDSFNYSVGSIRSVTGITPQSGSDGGGTRVVLTGTGFTPTMDVAFGNKIVGTDGSCPTTTSCTTTSPPGTGTVHITVGVLDGTNFSPPTQADLFTYIPFPAGFMAPRVGPPGGGTVVTVSGRNLSTTPGGTIIGFNFNGSETSALGVTCSTAPPTSPATIQEVCTMRTPPLNPLSAGPVDVPVSVTVDGKTSSLGSFTYQSQPPNCGCGNKKCCPDPSGSGGNICVTGPRCPPIGNN